MLNKLRYIQINETGLVTATCANPVFVDGVEITIDTEGLTIPEQPTDAIYSLYYTEIDGLHWVKIADFNKEAGEPTQLDRIESAVSSTLDEIRAEAVDEYTLSLMENNII